MRSYARVLIALGVLAAAFAAWWLANRANQPEISTDTLFAASFPDSQGQVQPIAQWRGKVLVINFWATWCPPCREEMPELSTLQEKHRAAGLVIIGIATDDTDKIREFARNNPQTYPLLAGDFDAARLAASLGNDKNVLPYTVVIGRDGQMVSSFFGRVNLNAMELVLQPLLNTLR